jgi:hypothetical protein
MIYVCPFCGQHLNRELVDGLTGCGHCNRVFDSSTFNRLLSGFWLLHHEPHLGYDQFKFQSKLSEEEALLVYTFFSEEYNHEEFQRALKNLGITPKIRLVQTA